MMRTLSDHAALILSSDNSSNNTFYFGKLGIETEKLANNDGEEKEIKTLIAYCSPDTSINTAINNESVLNAMKSINILNKGVDASSGLKGLFIPIENKQDDGTQRAHIISATSISNVEGSNSDIKTDVLFTPVNDIDSLSVTDDSKIEIDKYLYLKINDNNNINDSRCEDISGSRVLKYHLENIVNDKNSKFLTNDLYYGSYYSTFDGTQKTFQFTPQNTKFINTSSNSNEKVYTTDPFESMPVEFKKRFEGDNPAGIYRWTLCSDVNDFDVDELKNINSGSYEFDGKLKTIYTTSITPSVDTYFMWFNGLHVKTGEKLEENSIEFVLPGWSLDSENVSVFDFVKFVPVYENDFSISDDTALNLNYNVNITGDENNPHKNLTVHGSVNCDNLNVYKLTATGEIKNIFTNEDIVGKAGIKLGNTQLEDNSVGAGFVVDSEGRINAKSLKTTEYIESKDILTEYVDTDILKTDILRIEKKSDKDVFSTITIDDSSYVDGLIGVNGNNINDITLSAPPIIDDIKTDLSKTPVITTSLPSHFNENRNIVVSSEPQGSENIYIKNTTTNSISKSLDEYGPMIKGGTGVSEKDLIETTSCESAKNFNINRIYTSHLSKPSVTNKISEKCNVKQTNSTEEYFSVKDTFTNVDTVKIDLPDPYSLTYNDVNRGYIVKQTIDIYPYQKLDNINDISFTFDNDFICHIAISGEQTHGCWPYLHANSYMKLQIYYQIGEDETKVYPTNVYSTHSIDNIGYGNEWVGHNVNGIAYPGSDWGWYWRYMSFIFKPEKMSIKSNTQDFKDIRNALEKENSVTLFVVATFDLLAKTQKDWNSISAMKVYTPRILTNTNTADAILRKYEPIPVKDNIKEVSERTCLSYAISDLGEPEDIKSNTICNDGIVIRHGDFTFGIGYIENLDYDYNGSNYEQVKDNSSSLIESDDPHFISTQLKEPQPCLFYHKYDDGYYSIKSSNSDINSNTAYARRTYSIPLETLFEMVKAFETGKLTINN